MKRFGMLVLALLACSMMAMGCSSKEETTAAAETTAAETTEAETTAAETTAAETTEAATEAETTEAAGETSAYMAWTADDWNAAGEEERTAAAEAVLVEVGNAMVDGFGEMMELAKSDPEAKAELDAQIADMASSIDEFFSSGLEGLTLQDLVDTSKALLDTADTTAADTTAAAE